MKGKKVISIVLAVMVIFSVFSGLNLTTAFARNMYTSGDFTYQLEGDVATIKSYNGSDTEITIPATIDGYEVWAIEGEQFQSNTTVTNVVISDGIVTLGDYAFYGYTALESIVIPDTVTKISTMAFYNCKSLTSITIPESVEKIGDLAFLKCYSLTKITVDSNNGYFTSVDGVLFDKDVTKLLVFPGGKSGSYTVPSTVNTIYQFSFYACKLLESVMIPKSVTYIGFFAFCYCTSLTSLTCLNKDCEIYDSDVTINDSIALYGYCGSTLESYAETYDRTFYVIEGGHYYDSVVTEATCETDGYTIYTCSVCGDTYTETTSSAIGHSYTWITSNDSTKYECSVCSDVKATLTFTDISTETEYFDYIAYTSYYNSLITGVKANSTDTTTETFSPRTSLTRAMLVTILYRMAGSPYDDENPYTITPFSDVKAGVWYYNAVCWALDNGITTETKFKPNTEVTREQTATFLYRYAGEYLGEDVSTDNDISSYPDATSVSSYAQTAMAWANDKGMITGTRQGYLNPQGTTLRIHATKILYNFGLAYSVGNFE